MLLFSTGFFLSLKPVSCYSIRTDRQDSDGVALLFGQFAELPVNNDFDAEFRMIE